MEAMPISLGRFENAHRWTLSSALRFHLALRLSLRLDGQERGVEYSTEGGVGVVGVWETSRRQWRCGTPEPWLFCFRLWCGIVVRPCGAALWRGLVARPCGGRYR
jgi:hypothetical protein